MNRNLSLSQRIWNCAATQEAEFVHATHTYLHARANATEEWSQIWSQDEGCQLGPCLWPYAWL